MDETEQKTVIWVDSMPFDYKSLKLLKDEFARLRDKCDMQANILRRLTPETHPDTLFISGILGKKDKNGMPDNILVCPAYGVDFSYVYENTGMTSGTEW